ncbi:hypothetical protein [Qipengyuania sp.]|uniref:hypothetical protein n=1 Tax=Qipengyuania sp. TaxID=2004515 RepID=UPI0035C80D30
MALDDAGSARTRWISVAKAADIVGRRFHSDWCETDPASLEYEEAEATDTEAWHRANHVEELLFGFVTGGHVTAYALTDDGTATTDLPLHWVTSPAFKICLRTGACRLDFDRWEPVWIDEPELIKVLPKKGQPRKKHTYEWDKIVHEAWMFALRREGIPTNAEVVRHLGDWCPANRLDVPDGSHLSKVGKTVIDFLKENKTGRQVSESISCEAISEPGG